MNVVTAAVAGGMGAMIGAPVFVALLGLQAGGVFLGGMAAQMMVAAAVAGRDGVAASSVDSILHSNHAVGIFSAGIAICLFSTGAAAAVGVYGACRVAKFIGKTTRSEEIVS
ncbi:hypothetical protein HDU78_006195 [Chytriomyces hyalinus]|nr:hypothetical protein HDU78_006195 [Chytriomyces hyalinus]